MNGNLVDVEKVFNYSLGLKLDPQPQVDWALGLLKWKLKEVNLKWKIKEVNLKWKIK